MNESDDLELLAIAILPNGAQESPYANYRASESALIAGGPSWRMNATGHHHEVEGRRTAKYGA